MNINAFIFGKGEVMKKIESFEEVLYLLNQNEIVFLMDKGKATFFAQVENDRIRVNNEHVNYFMSIQQLKQLFASEVFYLYDKKRQKEEFVSDEKDAEYYSWKHK